MVGFLVGFVTGTGFGVFVAQKYDIPDVKIFLESFRETAKKYEKKDDKTS